MKNQNDLIFSIVAVVVLLIVFGCAFGMQPKPIPPAPPASVNTSDPVKPEDTKAVMANALPSGSSNNGMGGGMGGGMGMGAPRGPMGKMGGGGPAGQGMPGVATGTIGTAGAK